MRKSSGGILGNETFGVSEILFRVFGRPLGYTFEREQSGSRRQVNETKRINYLPSVHVTRLRFIITKLDDDIFETVE